MRQNRPLEVLKTAGLLLPLGFLTALLLYAGVSALMQSFGYIPAFDLTVFTARYYRELFTDPGFTASLAFSLKTAFFSAFWSCVAGVAISAAFLSLRKRRFPFLLLRLPILVPHTVTALFTILLFAKSGMISRALFTLGLTAGQEDFPNLLYTANGAGVYLAYLWKEVPFVAYFVASLMASVSDTLGEAAQNLGANRLRAFVNVTLPLTMPAIAKAFLILFAYTFGSYEIPFLLGATLPKALPVQAYLEYTHPDLRHKPYAMAMNGIILLFSIVAALIYYFLLNRKLKAWREKA